MASDDSNSAPDMPLSRRRRKSSTEEENPPPAIGKLTDDLLLEILIRLPNPRSTSRCKAVCKGWRSLISDPIGFNRRFVSHHRSRNQQPPLLLPSDDPQSIIRSFLPLLSTADLFDFEVLDSYKDLLLCGFLGVTRKINPELYRSYFLCNPFTKQWVALPLAPELPVEISGLCARLVCEPRISNNLDLGDDHQAFVYCSEYRFRVVRLYQHERSVKVDLFCSDSREWTKGVLVLDGGYYLEEKNVVSCNGELLFWFYAVPHQDLLMRCISAFNPFRPDIPPTAIDIPPIDSSQQWDISVSQGALHMVVVQEKPEPGPTRFASTIWRLEADRKFWRKLCTWSMKGSGLYEISAFTKPKLHPAMPEVVFFTRTVRSNPPPIPFDPAGPLPSDPAGSIPFVVKVKTGEVMSCNLKTGGELELFADLLHFRQYWNLFQAEFSCWPTSIPSYEELRVAYDGSKSFWVQRDDNKPTMPPSIAEEHRSI